MTVLTLAGEFGREGFGNLQRGERLTRTAGHNELPAIGVSESLQDVRECISLVPSDRVQLRSLQLARSSAIELAPVDRALLKVVDTDSGDRFCLVQCVKGVFSPIVRRADDDSLR